MADRSSPLRILVPLDGSDFSLAALPWTRTIAGDAEEIRLLRVVQAPLSATEITVAPEALAEVLRRNTEAGCAWLRQVADDLDDLPVRITRTVRVGAPPDEILRAAEAHGAEIIIMATHGRGAVGRAFIGSVADRVAQAATVPVMLIHPRADAEPMTPFEQATGRRLVVPLDGSERARHALPVAMQLASQLGVGIHLVRVVPSREATLASRDAAMSGDLYRRLVSATRADPDAGGEELYFEEYTQSIADALDAEAARLRSEKIDATSELLIGPTVPSLTDALAPDDVIVMTSHGEGGVRRWLMGSVAEKLIHMAAAPIVLVPDPARKPVAAADDDEWPNEETICPD